MKIWKFIKWQWNKFEFWQKTFIFAMFCLGSSWGTDNDTAKRILIGIGSFIFFFWAVKWFIYDSARDAYCKFREEENNLFSTIKNSDKK